MRASHSPAPTRDSAAVDICMPVYNAGPFVSESIESVLSQDFTNFRLLISVDKGDDNSAAICRKFASDERVQIYEQNKRLGYVANSNFLMKTATAPYMKFALHDDILSVNQISLLFEFMENEPGCSIGFPQLIQIKDPTERVFQDDVRGPVLRRMLDIIMNQRFVVAFHGLVRINKQAELRPLLPSGYPREFETDVLWMARAAIDGELRQVDKAIEYKRDLPGSTSRNWAPKTKKECLDLVVKQTADLSELAFTVCEDENERKQILMAAIVRLHCNGLNYGIAGSGQGGLIFNFRARRAFLHSLSGQPGQHIRRIGFKQLNKEIENDQGVVGASIRARIIHDNIGLGKLQGTDDFIKETLKMDPLAGWALPLKRKLNSLTSTIPYPVPQNGPNR